MAGVRRQATCSRLLGFSTDPISPIWHRTVEPFAQSRMHRLAPLPLRCLQFADASPAADNDSMGKTLFRENRNVADGTTQPVHPACRGSVAVPNRLLAQRYGPSTIEHSLNSTNVTCAACNEDARPILLIELGPEEPRYHDPCVRRLPGVASVGGCILAR